MKKLLQHSSISILLTVKHKTNTVLENITNNHSTIDMGIKYVLWYTSEME